MQNKKEEFFKWFRENRGSLDDETVRWAEYVAREFIWHDQLEDIIKNSSAAHKEDCLDILSGLDGLDARIHLDKSLRFQNVKKRNEKTKHIDLLLTNYFLNRSGTTLTYDNDTSTLTLSRSISNGKQAIVLSAKDLPVALYPELASKCMEISESNRKAEVAK